LAALTMASKARVVMSPSTMSMRSCMILLRNGDAGHARAAPPNRDAAPRNSS
jgi:hypothetical protein